MYASESLICKVNQKNHPINTEIGCFWWLENHAKIKMKGTLNIVPFNIFTERNLMSNIDLIN